MKLVKTQAIPKKVIHVLNVVVKEMFPVKIAKKEENGNLVQIMNRCTTIEKEDISK